MARAASPTPVNNLVAATATVSTPPTLAMELSSQTSARTLFAQAIVVLSTQAVFLLVWAVLLLTRPPVASVLRFTGRKRSHDDEGSSPAKRFCSDGGFYARALRFLRFVVCLLRSSMELPVVGASLA